MATPFKSRKYRLQNQRYGTLVRWWKAFPCECIDPVSGQSSGDCALCERDGRRYVEQVIANGLDTKPARVLCYESRGEISDTPFGPLPIGTAMMSVFPDLMPVARLDRVALLNRRHEPRRLILTRGATDFDALDFAPVAGILSARQNDAIVAPAHYALNDDRIQWMGATRPALGTRYTVEYQTLELMYCAHRVKSYGLDPDGVPLQDEWALSLKPRENEL